MKYIGLALILGMAGCTRNSDRPVNESIQQVTQGVEELTLANYDKYFPAKEPTFVEAYATWCGACEKMAPEVEKLGEYRGLRVLKFDVDGKESRGLEKKLGVRVESIPTVIFINGNEKHVEVGYMSYSEMRKWIDYHLRPR